MSCWIARGPLYRQSTEENTALDEEYWSQNQLAVSGFSHLRKISYSHTGITFKRKCSRKFIFSPFRLVITHYFHVEAWQKELRCFEKNKLQSQIHCSVVSVYILWGSLVYLFLLLCINSGSIWHEVRRGQGKHYREYRHLVWTTALFNVSRMLVNLTLLKSTVKHYAKYDITGAQTSFMIFNFIYKAQGWAGHRVQFKTQSPRWMAETSFASWVIHSRSDWQTQRTSKTWSEKSVKFSCGMFPANPVSTKSQ